VIDTAEGHHVAAGCWFGQRDQMTRTIRQGARFNVFSNDSVLLKEAIQDSFAQLRKK
jgi:2-keto-3-deoxy-L-rhamnonate aldolase RhmA